MSRYVLAIAFVITIGVVVDVRIDFAGAGRMFFSSLAFPLRLFRMLFSRELGLLGAAGTGLCLLAQARSLVTPLLEPPLAPTTENPIASSTMAAATTIPMIKVVLMPGSVPRPSARKPCGRETVWFYA